IPNQSRFCYSCAASLETILNLEKPDQSGSAAQPTEPSKSSAPHTSSTMVQVTRAEIEKRYAVMSDEELTALRRGDLTEVAVVCLDRELQRRGIDVSVVQQPSQPRQESAPIVGDESGKPTHSSKRSWLTTAIGCVLLVTAVLGQVERLS